MASPGTLAPQRLDRYLLPSERRVVEVRRHPAKMLEPVLSSVGGLVLVGWLDTYVVGSIPLVLDLLWLAWAAVVVRASWKFFEWRQDWFVATDQRLILMYGLVTRKVAMMPLSKVTDLSYNRSPLGRMLGYGEFVLESAGHDQAMRAVAWLPSPDVLYRRICAEIFDPRQLARESRNRPLGRTDPRPTDAGRAHDTEVVAVGDTELSDGTERPMPRRWHRR